MTTDQWSRGGLYIVIGCILTGFALSVLVRGWRQAGGVRWPLSWDMLTGLFLSSVAAVMYVNAARVLDGYAIRTDHRLSTAILAFCATMSGWMFLRWLRDDPMDGER